MSFAPNPGSLVRFKSGEYGLVVSVTPDGKGDRVVPLGSGFSSAWAIYEIAEIIYEPEHQTSNTDKERDS